VLIVATEQFTKPLSDVAADVLKRVGMDVDYQAVDTGTLLQRRASLKPPAEGGWNLLASTFPGLVVVEPCRQAGHTGRHPTLPVVGYCSIV
jgi:peptide/nickel transport system substrate-binding protein